ncbi:MAG TPA: hypothetical protein VKZ49_17605, partial [Polyangiaceae bacterium]|nr:hypothetical protein [Polyangiaceae bacterium]
AVLPLQFLLSSVLWIKADKKAPAPLEGAGAGICFVERDSDGHRTGPNEPEYDDERKQNAPCRTRGGAVCAEALERQGGRHVV